MPHHSDSAAVPTPRGRGDLAAACDALARLPLFASVSDEALSYLAARSRLLQRPAGDTILTRLTPARSCYGVTSGTVELTVSGPDGNAKVVEIIRADQTFGEAVMFLRRSYPVDAIAATDVALVQIPADAIDHLIDNDPHAARAMLASLSVRMHSLVRDIEMYTVQPARQRVLGYIAHRIAAEPEAGLHVEFAPSKRTVASRLGMSPETLSRVLRDLADDDIVTPEGAGVRVLDVRAITS